MSDERELFKGAAKYYSKYRARYPKEFFDFISSKFNLDGKGKLLDLGCGTGQISIPFSSKFEEVIGIDSEQDMLDEAKSESSEKNITNIKWICRKAEDIGEDLGTFRLTIAGKSFHWMDQKVVLDRVYLLTEKGGGFVIAGSVSRRDKNGWRIYNDEWRNIRKEVAKKYFGEQRMAGNVPYLESKDKFEDLLKQSRFGNCEEKIMEYTRDLTLEHILFETYSTSFVSRKVLGNRIADFEKDLRNELLKIEPSGKFVEHITIQILTAKKL